MGLIPQRLAVLLPAVVLLAITGRPAMADMTGALRVVDGDTIVLAGERIRLYGIDAPELGQTCSIKEHVYDCGMVARTALLDLTAGVAVTCNVVSRDPGADARDGRPGHCTAQGYDLSEGMAYTGWALALRAVSERYVVFEDQARNAGRGLWKGQFVMPWAWRKGARLPAHTAAE